jgi:hypothetical protein
VDELQRHANPGNRPLAAITGRPRNGLFLSEGIEELAAGLLAASEGLLADPAVLVMPRMPLILVAAALAAGHACFWQRPGAVGVVVRLAADHPGGGGADIDAIQAQPAAVDYLGQVLLAQYR